MAQIVKLKRSSVQGNIPTTSQIELGEIAINTYDGKIFISTNTSGTNVSENIKEIGGPIASINDIGDVVISSAQSGQILSLDTNGNWVNTNTINGNLNIENGTLGVYQIDAQSESGTGSLVINGGLQIDPIFGILNSISVMQDVDTTTTTPNNGDNLQWDGTNWVPGASAINDLTDVDTNTTAPQVGDTLVWDGTNWVPGTRVKSDPTGITGASAVANIVQISQADYDNITSPDPDTVYIING